MIDEHWPTRIYWADLDTINNETLIKAMLDMRGKANYSGGYTSYYDAANLHEREPFSALMKRILPHALDYMPPAIGTLEVDKSWCSMMPPGGFHPAHAHPLSHISGTYYPASVGSIVFHDPRVGAVAASFTSDPLITYQAVAGRLILFPSWLIHEVPVNVTNEVRFSFSFNIHNRRG